MKSPASSFRSDPESTRNADSKTIAGFGDEWQRFSFDGSNTGDLDGMFEEYFSIFPWGELPPDAVGADIGAGSGRWAARVAGRVGRLHVVDASSEALAVARRNLAQFDNCELHHSSVDVMPLAEGSLDFAYSLGVLHHVPDTRAALASCVRLLKPGAPFLLYLYYSLDNRALPYRVLFHVSDRVRRGVSIMPHGLRYLTSQVLAASVYWPLARASRVMEALGANVSSVPLSWYRNRSFYVMRNDALDRFGTRLEQRFSRTEIEEMMRGAGLCNVRFREAAPYWCAVGYRKIGAAPAA
jgi:ubiquinone/menaquinone biosynthesis C-methylase UbiE